MELFRRGLKDLGYEEGRTLVLEERWALGDNTRFPGVARDLLARRPAVVFSPWGPALTAIREVSRTLPVVAMCADAGNLLGELASLARPGGLPPDSGARKELSPGLSRVAILHYRRGGWETYWT